MTKRIVVGIDESAASQAALESAARIAASISAEIVAVFIEDVDVLAAAGRTGGSMISFHDASAVPLDRAVLSRALRVRARALRETVERIAQANRIPWRFEILHGRAGEEILRIAGSCEMIAIGASANRGRGRYGSTARLIIERAHCSVLVVRTGLPPRQRIVVLSKGLGRAEEIGASLAQATGALLVHQAPPPTAREAFDLLMRLAPTYLVAERTALQELKIGPRELSEVLKLEGLIITDGAPQGSGR